MVKNRSVQIKKEATSVDNGDPVILAIGRATNALTQQIVKLNDPTVIRALIVATAKGQDTSPFLNGPMLRLKDPAQWPKENHVALAAALAAAERSGKATPEDLAAAAKLLTAEQQADGSFGSPIDTWLARTALIASGIQPDTFAIVQIDKYVRSLPVETLSDALAATLGLELASDVMAENLRRISLRVIGDNQRESGAFGPESGPPPILETSLAVIALAMLDTEPRLARSRFRPEEIKDAIAKGKRYLASQQRPDGIWAGPLSTSGWALLALLSGS